MPRPVKGSEEAKAWGEKMRQAKLAKKMTGGAVWKDPKTGEIKSTPQPIKKMPIQRGQGMKQPKKTKAKAAVTHPDVQIVPKLQAVEQKLIFDSGEKTMKKMRGGKISEKDKAPISYNPVATFHQLDYERDVRETNFLNEVVFFMNKLIEYEVPLNIEQRLIAQLLLRSLDEIRTVSGQSFTEMYDKIKMLYETLKNERPSYGGIIGEHNPNQQQQNNNQQMYEWQIEQARENINQFLNQYFAYMWKLNYPQEIHDRAEHLAQILFYLNSSQAGDDPLPDDYYFRAEQAIILHNQLMDLITAHGPAEERQISGTSVSTNKLKQLMLRLKQKLVSQKGAGIGRAFKKFGKSLTKGVEYANPMMWALKNKRSRKGMIETGKITTNYLLPAVVEAGKPVYYGVAGTAGMMIGGPVGALAATKAAEELWKRQGQPYQPKQKSELLGKISTQIGKTAGSKAVSSMK